MWKEVKVEKPKVDVLVLGFDGYKMGIFKYRKHPFLGMFYWDSYDDTLGIPVCWMYIPDLPERVKNVDNQ